MNVFICPSFFSPDPPFPSCLTFSDRADASLTKRGQRSSTWCWIPDRQRSWLQSGTGMTIRLRDLYLSAKNMLKVCLVFTDSMDSAEVLIRFFCRLLNRLLKSCGFAMFRHVSTTLFCPSHSSRFYSNIVRSIWRSKLQNLVVSKGWSSGSLWMPWRLWNMSLGLGPSLKEMDLLQ